MRKRYQIDTGHTRPNSTALRECDRKLDQYRRLLEIGTDPALVGQWITEVQIERRHRGQLRGLTQSATADVITASAVREILEASAGSWACSR